MANKRKKDLKVAGKRALELLRFYEPQNDEEVSPGKMVGIIVYQRATKHSTTFVLPAMASFLICQSPEQVKNHIIYLKGKSNGYEDQDFIAKILYRSADQAIRFPSYMMESEIKKANLMKEELE